MTVTAPRYRPAVAEPWNPWRALRDRQHIAFGLHRLPEATGGGVYARWPEGDAVVIIDPRLPRRQRWAVLAHELIHDERAGGADHPGMPASWRAVVCRDEQAVDREVARRLIPSDRLAAYLERKAGLDEAVTAADVADEFDTTDHVAAIALRLHQGGNP